MKSLTIVEVLPSDKNNDGLQLKEVSRHFSTLWSSSTTAIGDNEWLIADMDGNLAVLKRNLEGVTSDDRKKLQTTGEFRLGEVVNKIVPIFTPGSEPTVSTKGKERARTISSAARPDTAIARSGPIIAPKAFLATVEGAIYMFGSINPAYHDALLRLQSGLASKVLAPGYMPWTKFRAWKTEVREDIEPFRFVDGEMVEQGLLRLNDEDLTTVLRETGLLEDGLKVTLEEARLWGEELRRLY
jgi:DNA damage-binding protein 1